MTSRPQPAQGTKMDDPKLALLRAYDDLENVIRNVYVPMLILDRDLKLRQFTPAATEMLQLTAEDIGKPVRELRAVVDFAEMESAIREVTQTGLEKKIELKDLQGGWHSLRVRAYQTLRGGVDGAVLTFMDMEILIAQAAESRIYAQAISETVRESILVLNGELRVVAVNAAFTETFRMTNEEVEGRLLTELGGGAWNIPEFLMLLREAIPKKTQLFNYEVRHEFPRIGKRVMLVNARQMRRARSSENLTLMAFRDVTEEKQAFEEVKKHSELLDLANDAIIVRDLRDVITLWNHGAEHLYGWRSAEARGKVMHELLKTEFSEPLEEIQQKLSSQGSWRGELRHQARSGKKLEVESRQVLQRDSQGRPLSILEINRDITLRKAAEESLRNLSTRLLDLQDEERRRIARELHDSMGQSLAALVIHLSAINERISGRDPESAEILKEAIQLAQQASDETRTLSYLLYPPTLDFSGLNSALQWFVDGLSQRSKLKIDLETALGPERLAQNLETALFRIMQEGLTNIYRHSESATARVRIRLDSGMVKFEISDSGKGIPPDILETLNGPGGQLGVGVRGMRERIRQLGGWLRIKSGNGGTTIIGVLPARFAANT
ncbi:MAG: PAS domain S-box protein [Candidatus Acidiferrales bacterium]